jgi:hypothetical protein
VVPKWHTKFRKDRSNGLKVIIFSKIQDGRRPVAAILDLLEILNLRVVALVRLKWPTKFQKDRSSGLKVIAITKIQDGRRPTAAILDFFLNSKVAGFSTFGFQVAHEISKRLVKRFKSYRDYKNPRWPPAYGRHLGFLKI